MAERGMNRSLRLTVVAPWVAAALLVLLAFRLLAASDFSVRASGWSLFGSAAICFSIGCVCRVSALLAQRR